MPRIFLFLYLALAAQALPAQDLHIYYDVYSDSIYYLLGGKPVDRPVVRKGNQVFLHVNNYNNYLYKAEVVTEQRQLAYGQSGGSFKLSKLLSGAGGANPSALIFGETTDMPELPEHPVALKSGFGNSQAAQALLKEMQQLESAFTAASAELEESDKTIAKIQKKAQTSLEAQQIQAFAAGEIQRLKYDARLSPAQIKKLSGEYMSRIFDETDPKQLNLSKVLAQSNAREQVESLKADYARELSGYRQKVEVLKQTNLALQDSKFGSDDAEFNEFRTAADKLVGSSEKNQEIHRLNLNKMENKLGEINNLDAKTLTQLSTDYLVTMENDFSKTIRETASADNLSLQLVLTPTVDSGVATRQLPPIEVSVYGGLQINASVGLSFGQFFERPLQYFVRDSLIQSSKLDAFTPYLTSFVHFYTQHRGNVSVGGSFGVGIPLDNGGGLEAITFFLGPSLMLGRNERIVLSAGLLGGRTTQLSGGFSVGDPFEADASLLQTASRYNLGYFMSLSFNLFGN